MFNDNADAQAQLDAWVEHYNHDRPHQGIGMVAPWERFRLADTVAVEPVITKPVEDPEAAMPISATRKGAVPRSASSTATGSGSAETSSSSGAASTVFGSSSSFSTCSMSK